MTLSEIVGGRVKLTACGTRIQGMLPVSPETPFFQVNDENSSFIASAAARMGMPWIGCAMIICLYRGREAFAQRRHAGPCQPQDQIQAKREIGLHQLCEEVAKWFEIQLA